MKSVLLWATVASLLVATLVAMVSATRTPTYEATARVLVDQKQEEQLANLGGSGEEIKTLPPPGPGRLQQLTPAMVLAIDTRPVAEVVIRRLDLRMSPDKLLDSLFVEKVATSQFIRLTYTDTDLERAARVVNTVGRVSSELISEANATSNNITATLYDKASGPSAPVSPKPLRNGLIALVVALATLAALIEARRRVFGG